jgi:phage/plasmid-associated DNA primase
MRFLKSVSASRKKRDDGSGPGLAWTVDEARLNLSRKGHTFVEYLSGSDVTKLYLDRDVYLPTHTPPSQEETSAAERDVRDRVDEIVRTLSLPGMCVTYRVATRHGYQTAKKQWKLSFRPYLSGLCIRYADVPKVIRFVNQQDFWDMSVYKAAEQLLACVNGKKSDADPRILQMEDANDSILDYLAQHVEDDWQLLDLPEDFGSAPEQTRENGKGGEPRKESTESPELLSGLLALLPASHADDRAFWIKVGLALKGAGAPYELFRDFSRSSDKFDEASCRTAWDSFRDVSQTGKRVGVGSLCMWAKLADPAGYARLKRSRLASDRDKSVENSVGVKKEAGTLDQALESTRKMIEVLKMREALVRVTGPAQVSESVLKTRAVLSDGREYTFELDMRDLAVRVVDEDGGERKTHVHASDAIAVVGHDLASLHKDIKSGQEWSLTRPTDNKARFTSSDTTIELLNADKPGSETAKVELLDMRKNARLTSKRDIAMLNAAMAGAQQRALVERLGLAWAIIGNNNQVNNQINIYTGGGPGELHTPDGTFGDLVVEHLGAELGIVCTGAREFYLYDPASGLWRASDAMFAAHRIRDVAKATPAFWAALSEADRRYVDGEKGCAALLDAICDRPVILDRNFKARLDRPEPGCIPFDNGVYDVATAAFRPLARADYVSTTIGYEYALAAADAREQAAFIADFYAMVFPVEEEREYFLRSVGCALFSSEPEKSFMVLTDERDGSNGKTTLMRAVEAVFGRYTAPAERSFLYEDSSNSANGHAANLLAYAGKRLAFFDEPEPNRRFAMRKIKELASGDARIRGREFGSAGVVDLPWQTFMVIACNESNFPALDASDAPMINRLKAVKMRSLFVAPERIERYAGEGHVFPLAADGFKQRLKVDCRAAHFHLIADAYRRVLRDGGIGTEPACVGEMVEKILQSSDPRIAWMLEFIDARIDFNPVKPPEAAGKHYYAWISQKDLMAAFWEFHTGDTLEGRDFRRALDRGLDKKSKWKDILSRAMNMRGRRLQSIRPTVNDARNAMYAFDKVAWKA